MLSCLALAAAVPATAVAARARSAAGGGTSAGGAPAEPAPSPRPGPQPVGPPPTGEAAPTPTPPPAPELPKVTGLTCRTACMALQGAQPGSVVHLAGEALETVAGVVFLGDITTPVDDVGVAAVNAAPGGVDAQVPLTARTGPVAVATAAGITSKPSRPVIAVGASDARAMQAQVGSGKVFFAGRRAATVDVYVPPGGATHVLVDLYRATDARLMAHWDLGVVPGGTVQSVGWNGVADRHVQKDGRYLFRVTGVPDGGATTAQAAAIDQVFTLLRHQFPVRGKYELAGGAGLFGAGRSGYSHQGQDIMAECGTPIVATRGGVVEHKSFQARAGNYVVIDGAGEGFDHAYMHLREPALVEEGQTVYTGQLIGYVGRTGDASACHLHFEVWQAPGWYSGGSPVDPLPILQSWALAEGGSVARSARASMRTAPTRR